MLNKWHWTYNWATLTTERRPPYSGKTTVGHALPTAGVVELLLYDHPQDWLFNAFLPSPNPLPLQVYECRPSASFSSSPPASSSPSPSSFSPALWTGCHCIAHSANKCNTAWIFCPRSRTPTVNSTRSWRKVGAWRRQLSRTHTNTVMLVSLLLGPISATALSSSYFYRLFTQEWTSRVRQLPTTCEFCMKIAIYTRRQKVCPSWSIFEKQLNQQ